MDHLFIYFKALRLKSFALPGPSANLPDASTNAQNAAEISAYVWQVTQLLALTPVKIQVATCALLLLHLKAIDRRKVVCGFIELP